ncbi:MAG: cytochrome c1 [Pseudohongiellaceae bacterium]
MLSVVLLVLLVGVPLVAVAAENNVELEPVAVDFDDKASLQRGWKNYMNYCFSCHSLQYARYERTANDLEIPHELVEENLIFADELIGDLMENSLTLEDAQTYFSAGPPDLTLVGRLRSPEWLYTYLKSFYQDDSRPFGTNNTVFPNVAMPNVLHELQGDVVCEIHTDGDDQEHCELHHQPGTGTLSEAEFDQVAADIANFLYYIGEPVRETRKNIGIWVLLFLAILYLLVFLMSREYQKDFHN